ncbi:unnamed protein product [Symbiodinium sp. CCMP2592]|nr:unnamed protein product [Symbiodinium sp. CCMP2592]
MAGCESLASEQTQYGAKRMKDRHEIIKDLFLRALDFTTEQQDEFLYNACDDESIRDEVRRMLLADAGTMAQELDRSPMHGEAGITADELTPRKIGKYGVQRVLGQGAMGVVYEATQSHPERRIAVKVLRRQHEGSSIMQRFTLEAQLLARLRHPGIAHVYDAGTAKIDGGTEDAQYIAMELINGSPVLEHATTEQLSRNQKLELVAKICDAVHHAHLSGVIHRDLKPSNILVEDDGSTCGQPKVLDFGVARASELELQITQHKTGERHLIGTIAYMSPEQVEGDQTNIDIRSDVYALGVVLYELLVGVLPHDLTTCSLPEAARKIRFEPPRRISSVDRSLKGDIDTIVHAALEPDPARRFQSAAALAEDLRRVLEHKPISVRTPGLYYTTSRFIRRNKALTAGVLIAVVGMGLGTGISIVQAREAIRERDAARLAESRSNRIRDFLFSDVLMSAAPERLGPNATITEGINHASISVPTRFDQDRELRAELQTILGGVYLKLTDLERAEQQIDEALAYFDGTDIPSAYNIDAMGTAARILASQGERSQALDMIDRAIEQSTQWFGSDPLVTTKAMIEKAYVLADFYSYSEAATIAKQVQLIRADFHGPNHEKTLESKRLALNYESLEGGPSDETDAQHRETIAQLEREQGPDHATTLSAKLAYGAYLAQNRFNEQAIAIYREALPRLEQVFGENQNTAACRANLGALYSRVGRYEEALPLMRRSLDVLIESKGESSVDAVVSMLNLSLMYYRMEDWQSAYDIAARAYPLGIEALGAQHQISLELANNQARPLRKLERDEEAVHWFDIAIELTPAIYGEHSQRLVMMLMDRALVLTRLERFDEARIDLERCETIGEQTELPSSMVETYREFMTQLDTKIQAHESGNTSPADEESP